MDKWLCAAVAVLAGLLLTCSGAFLAKEVKKRLRRTYSPESASNDFDPCEEFTLSGGPKRAKLVGDIERTVFFVATVVWMDAALFGAAIGWAALKLAANWGARLKGSVNGDEIAICAMSALLATLVSVGMALAGGLLAGVGFRAIGAALIA